MLKLNRSYKLTIEKRKSGTLGNNPVTGSLHSGDFIDIVPPFTIHFDIERKNFGEANYASFQIINLKESTRNSIRHDSFDPANSQFITLQAGYIGDYSHNTSIPTQLATLFKGNISRAYSVRQGVDFITHIEAYDAGFATVTAKSNLPAPASTPFPIVLKNLMDDLRPTVTFGAIGNQYSSLITRPNSYQGSTVQILKELTGNGFYIDNGKAYCLGDSECILGTLTDISAANGLLGTPYLENTFLSFDMLLEPRLLIGQMIFLKSTTTGNQGLDPTKNITNRQYKVVGLRHKGVISGTVAGEAVTTLSCLYGPNGLDVVGVG